MKTASLILGDQLSHEHPFLKLKNAHIVMVESLPRADWLPYHPKKLFYLYTCMRRFACEAFGFKAEDFQLGQVIHRNLRLKGASDFIELEVSYAIGSSLSIGQFLESRGFERLEVVDPAEPQMLEWLNLGFNGEIITHQSPFFLSDPDILPQKPPYLLENFYRTMRKRHKILLNSDGSPEGGRWNYDDENRLPPSRTLLASPPQDFLEEEWLDATDRILMKQIQEMLREQLPAHRFGDSSPPSLPTHRKTAKECLKSFIEKRLTLFGPYEDAMVQKGNALYHSGLSAVINLQILGPREVIQAALDADVPISSKEAFVRQILGWREFLYQIYKRHSVDYKTANFFEHLLPLPPLYWGGHTKMNCLKTAVARVEKHAYSHHIERLMVLGNFALLSKVAPSAINHWFWSAYLDAYEWVVTPNVMGMSQFADGGLFATKPYVSSANYINKMSDFCGSCPYHPKEMLADNACPFNALYWSFIGATKTKSEVAQKLGGRMGIMWNQWGKKPIDEQKNIQKKAEQMIAKAQDGTL